MEFTWLYREKTYWLLWSESWLTGERESNFWTVEYFTISGWWFVNAFWSFLVTFWVNANYQKPTQDKLIIIRFQAWFLRWKKFNNYTCLICVHIFKDNERVFSYCTFSLLKRSNHKYLCNSANYLIPWSLIRNKGAVCMKLVNFILWSFSDVSTWLGSSVPLIQSNTNLAVAVKVFCGCG